MEGAALRLPPRKPGLPALSQPGLVPRVPAGWSMWTSCCSWLCVENTTAATVEQNGNTRRQVYTNSGFSSSPAAPEHLCKACGGRFNTVARKVRPGARPSCPSQRGRAPCLYWEHLRCLTQFPNLNNLIIKMNNLIIK